LAVDDVTIIDHLLSDQGKPYWWVGSQWR